MVWVAGVLGCGQCAWCLRLAAHLRTLRFTTRGLARRRLRGLRLRASQWIARNQNVSACSGC